MEIAILAFDHITALDAVGPHEVLMNVPGAEVRWVGLEPGLVEADGGLRLEVQAPVEALTQPDVVVVPGGYGVVPLMREPRVLEWLRHVHARTRFTASVCTGALLLGAAGLLRGRAATTHWARLEQLRDHGATPTPKRVVVDERVVTAAGVSAGIDMALILAERLAGREVAEAIQLGIEYDPAPPFDAGHPARARPELRALLEARMDSREESVRRASLAPK